MRFGRHNSKEGELVRREAVIRNMDEFIICGGTIVTGTLEPNNRLAVSKGKIRFLKTGEELSGVKTISAEGLYIAPGVIDLHVHGGYGADVLTAPANPWSKSLLTMEGAVPPGLLLLLQRRHWSKWLMLWLRWRDMPGRKRGLGSGHTPGGPVLNPRFNGAMEQKP